MLNTMLRILLPLCAIAISLSGCDNKAPSNAEVKQRADELAAYLAATDTRPIKTEKKSGAHGSYDPHQNLGEQKLIDVAVQHMAEGRVELALQTLGDAIAKHPMSASLYGVRGSLYLQIPQPARALSDFNRAIDLAPHNPVYFTNRSQALRQFGRIEEAMLDLDSAIELDSQFVAARFNRGSLFFEAGDFEQALSDFSLCIEVDPETAAPYFNRASTYDAIGDRINAVRDLQQFLKLSPSAEWAAIAEDLIKQWDPEADSNSNQS